MTLEAQLGRPWGASDPWPTHFPPALPEPPLAQCSSWVLCDPCILWASLLCCFSKGGNLAKQG